MELKPGDRIANYQLVKPLGRGGMASVWLCKRIGSSGFARDVVLKFMDTSLETDPSFKKMFETEARLASYIHHPNIISVEELGETQGVPYMVMEYVAGCTLAQLIEGLRGIGRGLGPALAVAIALRVADALQAAHDACDDQGKSLHLVHRDVSPSNILLGFSGFVKLADFGVAKTSMLLDKTKTGVIKGKFQYMSPEQVSGQALDVRTDVFALGVVVWEMLTSHVLFEVSDVASYLNRLARHPVRPPSELVEGIPEALDRAVLDALKVEPTARLASAYTFKKRLAKALPEALTIDSSQIAAVVRHVMREELRHDKTPTSEHVVHKRTSGVDSKLKVIKGPKKGDEFPLSMDGRTWVVGRGRQASISIPDDELSRKHFQITSIDQMFELRDLDSKNGTRVNQKQVTRVILKDGDVIHVGMTQIKFIKIDEANEQATKLDFQRESIHELTRAVRIDGPS